MTPNHTAAEIHAMRAECKEALLKSESASGLERLQLINKAFPFAINNSSAGLLISWTGDGFSVSDNAGFITKLDRDDVCTMLVMIGMETAKRGSVREVITGEKKKEIIREVRTPIVKIVPKGKLQLKDIGL